MMTKRKRRLAALKGWRSRKRNPSKRTIRKRVGAALKKWMRGNPWTQPKPRYYIDGLDIGYRSLSAAKKRAQSIANRTRDIVYISHYPFGPSGDSKGQTVVKPQTRALNPSRVKGRKVKGGRAVTLKNMKTITITRHRNGAVSVKGVQLRKR